MLKAKLKQPQTKGALLVGLVVLVLTALFDFLRGASFLAAMPEVVGFGSEGWEFLQAKLSTSQRSFLGLTLAVLASSAIAYQVIAWWKAGEDVSKMVMTPSVPCFLAGVALVLAQSPDHLVIGQIHSLPFQALGGGSPVVALADAATAKGSGQVAEDGDSGGTELVESGAGAPPASTSGAGTTSSGYCECSKGEYQGSGSAGYGGGASGGGGGSIKQEVRPPVPEEEDPEEEEEFEGEEELEEEEFPF